MPPSTETGEAITNNQQQNRPRGGAIENYQGHVLYTGQNHATRTNLKPTHLAAVTSTVVYSSFSAQFIPADDSTPPKKSSSWNPFKRASSSSASSAGFDNTRGSADAGNLNRLNDTQLAQVKGHDQNKKVQGK